MHKINPLKTPEMYYILEMSCSLILLEYVLESNIGLS
jgi:hypothetical protein